MPKNEIDGAMIVMADATKFVKLVPVRAKQMACHFYLAAGEGFDRGAPGDYIVQAPSGQRWICPRQMFEAIYVRANDVSVVPTKDGIAIIPKEQDTAANA